MNEAPPWTVTPEFSEDRLMLVAGTLARVRENVLNNTHDPSLGDDAWTFGVLSYRRGRTALERLELTKAHPWLHFESMGPIAYAIYIDSKPIRIFCGDVDIPVPARQLSRAFEIEQRARNLFLPFSEDDVRANKAPLAPTEEWPWFMRITSTPDLAVASMVMFQCNWEREQRNTWTIPHDMAVRTLVEVDAPVRVPVVVPPPVVRPKAESEGKPSLKIVSDKEK